MSGGGLENKAERAFAQKCLPADSRRRQLAWCQLTLSGILFSFAPQFRDHLDFTTRPRREYAQYAASRFQ
jgi:hypothetical protein